MLSAFAIIAMLMLFTPYAMLPPADAFRCFITIFFFFHSRCLRFAAMLVFAMICHAFDIFATCYDAIFC